MRSVSGDAWLCVRIPNMGVEVGVVLEGLRHFQCQNVKRGGAIVGKGLPRDMCGEGGRGSYREHF